MHKVVEGGFFVTFEGPEGSGKSTQISLLGDALTTQGIDVLRLREPGGTPLGEGLRALILASEAPDSMAAETELLLFGASRAQLMHQRILPHLAKGGVVLCDRFADSTTAYQGYGRSLDAEFIERMHEFTVQGRWPDLTFLLDLTVEEGFQRVFLRNGNKEHADRIEAESRAFHERVRKGYLDLARIHPKRFRVLDATRSTETIHKRIMEMLTDAIG
ncbi:MAG: dTMP kinase [Lentisphaeria bacterium]|nr:dTMP kinase [Lentisphaeria bacterium]